MAKGNFIKIAVNHEVVRLLSDDGSCVDSFLGENDTSASSDVARDSFDGCMYDRLTRMSMEELGCTVPWLPDKTSICVAEEDRQAAFHLYQKNRRNQVSMVLITITFITGSQ